MLVPVLSVVSIILGSYLIFEFWRQKESSPPVQTQIQYHMGCYSMENKLNYSASIKAYLEQINAQSNQYQIQKQSFQLAKRIDFRSISTEVARDFNKYLGEYYDIKNKGIYEQNYYQSLNRAEQKFQSCKSSLVASFDRQTCLDTFTSYHKSFSKYENLKEVLTDRIKRKNDQQIKIESIISIDFDSPQKAYQNLTNQINFLERQIRIRNERKEQIVKKNASLYNLILSNQSKLDVNIATYNQCTQNMKNIKICIQINNEIKSINLTFTRETIQLKIQKRKSIIAEFANAKRMAQKSKDQSKVFQMEKQIQNLNKEVVQLQEFWASFKDQEQSFCMRCSSQRIQQLKIDIQSTTTLITQFKAEMNVLKSEFQQIEVQITKYQQQIDNFMDKRENSEYNFGCMTEQCQLQRNKTLQQHRQTLNELKKQVIDYKMILTQHQMEHNRNIQKLGKWSFSLSQVINCIYDKQFYQALKQIQPEHSTNEVMKLQQIKSKLKQQLQAYGQ